MNLEWLRKNISFLAVSGISLILVGSLFSPFLRHAPGKDDTGYYILSHRSEERIYSEGAKQTYYRWHLCNIGVHVGLGMIIFIPIIIVFDRNRKRNGIKQQTKHDHDPNEA